MSLCIRLVTLYLNYLTIKRLLQATIKKLRASLLGPNRKKLEFLKIKQYVTHFLWFSQFSNTDIPICFIVFLKNKGARPDFFLSDLYNYNIVGYTIAVALCFTDIGNPSYKSWHNISRLSP